jgi:hypothetical protein
LGSPLGSFVLDLLRRVVALLASAWIHDDPFETNLYPAVRFGLCGELVRGAKSTPGTGDFDDMGRGDDHL